VVGVERIAASDRCYPIGADRRSRPGLSKPASGPPARTPRYVRAWAEKYQDRGLVVVGVRTPEFPFEQDADNVRWAANDMHVEYPIALDPNYAVWGSLRQQVLAGRVHRRRASRSAVAA
jgi:hypothetical protein